MLTWVVGGLAGFALALALVAWRCGRAAQRMDDAMSKAWRLRQRDQEVHGGRES